MPRFVRDPRRASPGMFTGNPPPPQDSSAIVGEFQGGLMDDPGIRLSYTTGRRLWSSGLLEIQRFLRRPAGPNTPEDLEALPLQLGNSRRTLSRFRGVSPRAG